jgi:hypothetical protein
MGPVVGCGSGLLLYSRGGVLQTHTVLDPNTGHIRCAKAALYNAVRDLTLHACMHACHLACALGLSCLDLSVHM